MSEELANAGTESAAPATGSDASFSGGQGEADKSSAPRKTGIKAAYEAAKAELDAKKPKSDAEKEVPDRKIPDPVKDKPAAKPAAKASEKQPANDAPIDTAAAAPKIEGQKAPERWPAEWKATYEKLGPEGQQLMLDQHKGWERGYNQKFEEFAKTRKQLDAVTAAIPEGMRQVMQQRGVEAPAVIGRLFALQQQSESDPVGFIAEFMQRAKVDPRALAQRLANPQQQLNPALLAPLMQPLQQKIAQLEAAEKARESERAEERNKSLEAAFSSFIAEKDESGSPKHPHMERVADHVVAYLESNASRLAHMEPRQRLEQAYNYAVYADPSLRDEIVTAEASKKAAALEQERTTDRLSRAATAKPRSSTSGRAERSKGLKSAFLEAKKEMGAA